MRIKYPRTRHLPWSPGGTDDDERLQNTDHFEGRRVVATVKMDGECTTMTRAYTHARSTETKSHPSRDYIRALHGRIAYEIPEDWRVCGENLYARHSISYRLSSYFMVFSIWNEHNYRLPWSEICEWAALLGLTTVPVLYEGIWNTKLIQTLHRPIFEGNECEGLVVSTADSFHYDDFGINVAKYVRAQHVQTDSHWLDRAVVPNELIT